MKLLKNTFSLTIALVLLINCLGIQAAAADTSCINVPVVYGQTEARKMISLINQFRTGSDAWYWNENNTQKVYISGLGNLTYDYDLEQAAMIRAAEIAVSFSHTRPDDTICFSAYDWDITAAENIALGYNSAENVFVGWQETFEPYADQGHRRNMLNQNVKAIGIGHAIVNGVHCWVQEFRGNIVNPDPTKANDSEAVVPINVLNSAIKSKTITLSSNSITLDAFSTASLPALNISFLTTETWSYIGNISGTLNSTWTVADTEIAKIESGKITGLSAGTTTLKTTAFGNTYTVTCTVTANDNTGDINADGTINSTDALIALEHSIGKKILSGDKFSRGDVTKDKTINSIDALMILQYSAGIINKF